MREIHLILTLHLTLSICSSYGMTLYPVRSATPPRFLSLSSYFVLLPFSAYFSFCSRIDSIICCCVLVLEVMFRSNPHRIYNLSIYVSLRVPEISVERYFFCCCSVHRIPFSKARHNLNPIHTLYAYTTSREHADCAVFMHLCKQRVQSC